MLLAIDAGNTNTVFAVFEENTLRGQWRMTTDARRTADEYGLFLLQLLERQHIQADAIHATILSSVVPSANFSLRMLSRQYFHTELMIVGDEHIKLGIGIAFDRPREIGADRLMNAVAAWQRHNEALIIVDFGTATTFDVVSDKGDYLGGVIAPGVNLSLETLHRAAAQLPHIAVQKPTRVIGTETIGAMQSGIYFGYIGLIEGIVSRIKAEFGKPMRVVATGGLAPLFAQATQVIDTLEPDLIIEGLNMVYQRNKK